MNGAAAIDEWCVRDVMSPGFISAAPEDTLGKLAESLVRADAGSALVFDLPVTENGRPHGVVGLRAVVGVLQECPGF
jgi:hypothetical protein